MYDLIHGIPFFAAMILAVILCWKKVISAKKSVGIGLTGLVLALLLYFVPFENLFVTFSAPEDVLRYVKNEPVLQIAEGQQSAAIMYQSAERASSKMFARKQETGYKLSSRFSWKTVSAKQQTSAVLQLIHVDGTDDYYLYYVNVVDSDTAVEIWDNASTNFEMVSQELSDTKTILRFIVYIPYSSDYTLYINGEEITFAENG